MGRRIKVRDFREGPLRYEDDLGSVEMVRLAAELGSLVAVARRLKLDKTGVQHRIGRLEARLGVVLLERTTRRLRLTPAGETYLRRYPAVLETLRQARSEVSGRNWGDGKPGSGTAAGSPAPVSQVSAGGAAAALPAAGATGPGASTPSPDLDAMPARVDLMLRRVEGGLWAVVSLPRELVCVGATPAEALARMAAALAGPAR
jgi:DNA-binding transcriptional LysR family regulator